MTAFTADTTEFRTAVCKVVRVAPERPAVPVLGGVLLVAGEGSVEVLATDYTATHRVIVAADVKTPGRVLVVAELLARMARNLPGDQLAVELDRSTLTLSSEKIRFSVLTMPEDDYPTELPADADLSKVQAAGPDSRERALTPPKMFTRWKPSRAKALYDPTGMQPGAPITWHRKVGDEYVEVSGQVWSPAPKSSVWALVEGERHPSLVAQCSRCEGTWGTDTYRTINRLEESEPHWEAFPAATEPERTAA